MCTQPLMVSGPFSCRCLLSDLRDTAGRDFKELPPFLNLLGCYGLLPRRGEVLSIKGKDCRKLVGGRASLGTGAQLGMVHQGASLCLVGVSSRGWCFGSKEALSRDGVCKEAGLFHFTSVCPRGAMTSVVLELDSWVPRCLSHQFME